MPIATCHNFLKYSTTIARIAPSWIRIDKALPEGAFAEIEEALRQQQVAGRGNRQEFGDTLDDAENHCPYCI